MSLLMAEMRLVGAFPFVKKCKAKPLKEAKLNHPNTYRDGKQPSTFLTLINMEDDVVLQISTFWTFWTVTVGVAAMFCFAIGCWNLQYQTVGFVRNFLSTFYASKIKEFMANVIITGLMLYAFCRKSLLRQLVEFFYHNLRGRNSNATMPSFPLIKVIPLAVNLTCTIFIVILLIYRYGDLETITQITATVLQEIVYSLQGTSILLLLELTIFHSIHEYNCIITSLHTCLGNASRYPDLTHYNEHQEITPQALSVFRSNVMHCSDAWAEPRYSIDNRDLASPFQVDHCLLEAEKRLIQVNKLLHLMNRYCGVPITLIMLFSVVSGIMSLFYMSFFLKLDTYTIAIIFLSTINSLMVTVFFCNAPHSLHKKVVRQCLLCHLQHAYLIYNLLKTHFIVRDHFFSFLFSIDVSFVTRKCCFTTTL